MKTRMIEVNEFEIGEIVAVAGDKGEYEVVGVANPDSALSRRTYELKPTAKWSHLYRVSRRWETLSLAPPRMPNEDDPVMVDLGISFWSRIGEKILFTTGDPKKVEFCWPPIAKDGGKIVAIFCDHMSPSCWLMRYPAGSRMSEVKKAIRDAGGLIYEKVES